MKKEYYILIATLLIIGISGIAIGLLQKQDKKPVETSAAQTMPEQPQINRDAILAQIVTAKKQLASSPGDRELMIALGNMYYDLDSSQTAIIFYEKALKINPDDAMVLVDCGAMYRASGNSDKAIEYFKKAIEINPQLAQAYFNLGIVLHMEKGDREGAIEAWKKYLELEPNSPIKGFLKDMISGDAGS
jgi:tetratricopeptide (TPR) repeat protein